MKGSSTQAEQMIRAANGQAAAAIRLADTMQDIYRAQQRPWIQIDKVNLALNMEKGPEVNVPYYFGVSVKNIGPVPATNVSIFGYAFFPITGKEDERVLLPRLREAARNECTKKRDAFSSKDSSVGMSLFPGAPTELTMAAQPLTNKSFLNGMESMNAFVRRGGGHDAAVVFNVYYQSSINGTIHCTAEAYRMSSSGGDPLFTADDILSSAGLCMPLPKTVHISEKGMGVGYAD